MKVFFTVFIILLLMLNNKELIINTKEKKIKISLSFLFIGIVMILVSTFREYLFSELVIGADYNGYKIWYNDFNSFNDLNTFSSIGFNILIILTKKIYNNYLFFLFITNLIIILNFLNFIKKNSNNPNYSLFIFVAFGLYELSFNGLRQFLACSIWLLGYDGLKNKSLKKYLFFCLLATTFHSSAIVLLLLYPAINNNINFKYKTIIACFLGVILSFPNITNQILNVSLMIDENYAIRYGQNSILTSDSNLTVFFISMLIFCFIIFNNKDNLKKVSNINLQYLLVLCIFSFLAPVHIIYSRIYLYFMPSLLLAVPDIFMIYNSEKWKILKLIISILFIIMFLI